MQISKAKKGYKLVDTGFGKEIEIPEEWKYEEFQTILKKENIKKIKIKTSGYENEGKIPIIDQGQDLICGYTDDSSLIYSGELPVIVFGDHTLVVKFINFPFAVGADGTKIIQINKEKGLVKFFYYAIQNRNLESEGYKRHFSKLREEKFCYPPSITEQENIVNILSNVDYTLTKTNQLIEKTQTLKKGLMQKLFTKGIEHTKFKKIEWLFGKVIEIPEEWEIKKIKEITKKDKKVTYGVLQPGNFDKNGIILIRGKDYIKGWAKEAEFFKVDPKIHQSYIRAKISSGDILMNITGVGIGSVNQVPEWIKEANITQNTARISCDEKIVYSKFILNYLKSDIVKRELSRNSKTSAQPSLSLEMIKNYLIIVPSISEQKQIAGILSNVDSQITKEKLNKSNLEILKKGLMQKLLTGQIRVKV